jgi:HSP20 family protein
MGMDRWDPFREMMTLRDAMDRLVQQSFVRPSQLLATARGESIALDVLDRGEAYEVRAALPGVRPDDVDVTIQGDQLTVRGETRAREERSGDNWLVREQRVGTLERSITLPGIVNSESAEARLENGILVLRLPKAQETRPRRITVGSSAGSPSAASSSASTGASEPIAEQAEVGAYGTLDGHPGGVQPSTGRDTVTEQSQESFPASDPPSWSGGRSD